MNGMFDLKKDLKIYRSDEYDKLVRDISALGIYDENNYYIEFCHSKKGFVLNFIEILKNSKKLIKIPIEIQIGGFPQFGFCVDFSAKEPINFLSYLGFWGKVLGCGKVMKMESNLLKKDISRYLDVVNFITVEIDYGDRRIIKKLSGGRVSDYFFASSKDFSYSLFDSGNKDGFSSKSEFNVNLNPNSFSHYLSPFIHLRTYFKEDMEVKIKVMKKHSDDYKNIRSIKLLIPKPYISRLTDKLCPKNKANEFFYNENSRLINLILNGHYEDGCRFDSFVQNKIFTFIFYGKDKTNDTVYSKEVEKANIVRSDFGVRSIEDAALMFDTAKKIVSNIYELYHLERNVLEGNRRSLEKTRLKNLIRQSFSQFDAIIKKNSGTTIDRDLDLDTFLSKIII